MDTIRMFEHIASLITVGSICTPVNPKVRAADKIDDLTGEVAQSLNRNEDNPWPVVDDNGDVVGMLWPDNTYPYASEDPPDPSHPSPWVVSEVMETLRPYQLVSWDTNILDAVELFGRKSDSPLFYVNRNNEIVGILRESDMSSSLARLAFLTLALEIEDLALLLCANRSNRNACWGSLPETRKKKALDLFKQSEKRDADPDKDTLQLIEYTYLNDKAKMIWKNRLLPVESGATLLSFFNRLQNVRDLCAHPSGRSVLPREVLPTFIQDARAMRERLLAALSVSGISRGPHFGG